MGLTAFQGLLVGYATQENPGPAPSVFASGVALGDPRAPFAYANGGNTPLTAFLLGTSILALDGAPSAIAAANIAAAQVPVAGATLALTAGAGVTMVSLTNNATGAATTAYVLDGSPATLPQGSDGVVQLWNPGSLLARNVRVTSAGNDSGATFLVTGFDIYGFPMSEAITGANAGVASGRKAFKYIAAITPTGALSGSNVTVGTGDVYGLPIRADQFAYAEIYWNGSLISTSTGFTAADQTSPSNSTTGDVRGTYAVPTASDGTKRLQIYVSPTAANAASPSGLFGQTQA